MQFSGSEGGLQLPLQSWFLGPTPTEYPGAWGYPTSLKQKHQKIPPGQTSCWVDWPTRCIIVIVETSGAIAKYVFRYWSWWLPWRSVFIYCTDEHTWTDSQGAQMGNSETMASSVSFRGNNNSNLVREDLTCRDKQKQCLGHPAKEALARDSAVRLRVVRNPLNH